MRNVLITGATGNVGVAVIDALSRLDHQLNLYAGVRDPDEDQQVLRGYNLSTIRFDFTDTSTFRPALGKCEILFLLRPPQISDVKKYVAPLIQTAGTAGVRHIVFLSVQGVQNSSIIPHHKIEKLIVESGVPYTFLRPAYFMQNFNTTLRNDLVSKKRIFLPAGRAPFALIDVRDIGAVAARILMEPEKHRNQVYDLTSHDKLTFGEMAEVLSKELGTPVNYRSPNLLHFFIVKRRERMPVMYILVMIMLHYLPRFQKEPPITRWVEQLTGQVPIAFNQYVRDYKDNLTSRS